LIFPQWVDQVKLGRKEKCQLKWMTPYGDIDRAGVDCELHLDYYIEQYFLVDFDFPIE
jgi:hypothetical protein